MDELERRAYERRIRLVRDKTMRDQCIITRDLPGTLEGLYDPDTMTFSAPTEDERHVIYRGHCALETTGQPTTAEDGGGVERHLTRVAIPSVDLDTGEDTEVPKPGDRVFVVEGGYDDEIVSTELTVRTVARSTIQIFRTVECVEEARHGVR